ncbi:MAG: Lacal_2735 family protein [Schleiferiaceae bacterium]|jgi:hypothetical protein|nr:Lacal_2735 family protein [Schleiferiaceae bacterium]MDG2225905.1 Lacal_2735 family protein [Schleiferiaceae bacterium]MDO7592737.1 Lacal_2735 family protein [Schleiferiaceae bacterium]
MKLFTRKSKKEKLQKQYRKKLEEAHKMSTISRAKSDQLTFQAEQILKEIENEN